MRGRRKKIINSSDTRNNKPNSETERKIKCQIFVNTLVTCLLCPNDYVWWFLLLLLQSNIRLFFSYKHFENKNYQKKLFTFSTSFVHWFGDCVAFERFFVQFCWLIHLWLERIPFVWNVQKLFLAVDKLQICFFIASWMKLNRKHQMENKEIIC